MSAVDMLKYSDEIQNIELMMTIAKTSETMMKHTHFTSNYIVTSADQYSIIKSIFDKE